MKKRISNIRLIIAFTNIFIILKKLRKEKTEKAKINVKASVLYNDLLGIIFDEYCELSDAERKKNRIQIWS